MYRLMIVLLMLCLSGTVEAYGSLRCQGKMIRPGDDMAEVLDLCGPPGNRIVEQVPVRSMVASGYARFSGFAVIENWVYDRGWGKFPAVLKFEDGELTRVDYLRHRSRGRAGN